ncbi:putative peptidyl-prolyl cis-trans isomerase e [Diaporthe ampelina]|uniref:Putative peptidyl-prolyl cis-trans isomerase e n=1 Tax=Diaporthe ampelina TaxID=1214573 RepID=A0A0G2HQU5_9PEZI|nr:putative peptidyl-prolyl cis-trans isomerase e [Diaporthe ampelina]
MTDTARWKATVHVSGLATVATVATLHDAFLPFGDIADVTLPKNENPNSNTTEPHRGFAYVEFENADDAKEAIDNMDQSEFFGRVIKVTAAKIPKSADEGLGSKKAVWEQESWLAKHAVSEEDRLAAEQAQGAGDTRAEDPMQGLEGLDVAGPRPA